MDSKGKNRNRNLLIAIVGLALSLIWWLIMNRRREATMLVSHQARELETRMFAQEINSGSFRSFFPMFFHGNRGVFMREGKGASFWGPQKMMKLFHIVDTRENLQPRRIPPSAGFSESSLMNKYTPFFLIAFWTAYMALAMYFVFEQFQIEL